MPEVSPWRSLWFWLVMSGIILSALSTILYLMDLSDSIVYVVGAAGALLIFGGAVAAILRKPEVQATSENISTEDLTRFAAQLLKTTPQELDMVVTDAALRLKATGGSEGSRGSGGFEPPM